jgi:hypothetical protein
MPEATIKKNSREIDAPQNFGKAILRGTLQLG